MAHSINSRGTKEKVETLYILHQNGAKSHYNALLSKESKYKIRFREFGIIRGFLSGVKHKNLTKIFKQVQNTFFFFLMFFRKKTKIILGIAPYDWALPILLFFTKKHDLYYHTSWTDWTGDFAPYNRKLSRSTYIRNTWAKFLQSKVTAIFCVSNRSKQELTENYNITCPIQVVYHSLENDFEIANAIILKEKPKLIFAARIEKYKGVCEFLRLAEIFPEYNFTIIGSGSMNKHIVESINRLKNIKFLGYIDSKSELQRIYSKNNILINLSKRVDSSSLKWEELFGISLIEAMACGLCPISTNHSGPSEIIHHAHTGFLVNENSLIEATADIINWLAETPESFYEIRLKCVEESKKYTADKIYNLWQEIFYD